MELPAKAASVVANARDKSSVAESVIQAVVNLRPAAMPSVVGCIIQRTPSVGSEVVAEAEELVPAEKAQIAEAAAPAVQSYNRDKHGGGNDNGKGNGNGNGNGNG